MDDLGPVLAVEVAEAVSCQLPHHPVRFGVVMGVEVGQGHLRLNLSTVGVGPGGLARKLVGFVEPREGGGIVEQPFVGIRQQHGGLELLVGRVGGIIEQGDQ